MGKYFLVQTKKQQTKATKIQFSITPPHLHIFYLGPKYGMQQDAIAVSQGRRNEKFIALRKKPNLTQTRT
jgi:hypothetical protein